MNTSTKLTLEELLALQGQLRREIEHAKKMRLPCQKACRQLVSANKKIARLRQSDPKGSLFDTQIDLKLE